MPTLLSLCLLCVFGGGISTATAASPTQFHSEYTSLAARDCPQTDSGIDFAIWQCPGREGFRVIHTAGEGASSLTLKRGKLTIDLAPDALNPAPLPAFSSPYVAGEKLEWRYRTQQGHKMLAGLIYRIGDQIWHGEQSLLFVVRANGDRFCPLGLAPTNAAARKLLDSDQPCSAR